MRCIISAIGGFHGPMLTCKPQQFPAKHWTRADLFLEWCPSYF